MRHKRISVWILPGLCLLLLSLGAGNILATHAQTENRAALVVSLDEDTVITTCVSFTEEQITGYQLLQRSGLAFESMFDPNMGAFICSIEGQGCPKTDCQCQVPLYWSYWHMERGQWVYNVLGASNSQVVPGQVDGWAWSEGQPPPVYTFEQVCGAQNATITPSPTLTNTIAASLTPTATDEPTQPQATPTTGNNPTETPTQTNPPTATPTQNPYPAVATTQPPLPTNTPTPAAYPADRQEITPIPTNTPITEGQTEEELTPTAETPTIIPYPGVVEETLPMPLPTDTTTPTPVPPTQVAAAYQTETPGWVRLLEQGLLLYGVLFLLAGLTLFYLQATPKAREQWLRYGIYLLTAGIGILSFLYPFFSPGISQALNPEGMRSGEMFYLLLVILGVSFLVMIIEVQGKTTNAKTIALLGVLTAVNATLRFVEVAFPGPGGFSPIFFLIILVGFIYGGSMGFLLGVLTILASALITGGVGPWLPGQMFAAGWVGLSVPLARPLIKRLKPHLPTAEIWVLAGWGAIWGILYGVIMNLWFWPFFSGPAEQYYQAGINAIEIFKRYMTFYVTTSLAWDIVRAAGNFLLLYFFGKPVLRVLRRFRKRLTYQFEPTTPGATDGGET